MVRPSYFCENKLADKQIVIDVNAVDLFRSGSEEHLKSFSHTGHDRGDLTGRNHDLLLNKLGRIKNL